MIRLLQRNKINDERWNSIIAASPHETIYPYTWYMDACAVNWAAYVMQDYECVMPVAFNRKLVLKYVYQPYHCQQSGVFSIRTVDPEIARMFLLRLKSDYLLADYAFNDGNLLPDEPGVEIIERTNYTLNLQRPYTQIVQDYNTNCRRNIKKAAGSDLEFIEVMPMDEILRFKSLHDTVRRSSYYSRVIPEFFTRMFSTDRFRFYGIRSSGNLIAMVLFAVSQPRLIYLVSASNAEGKEKRAMFSLVNSVIEKYAGEKLLLDFEGSDVPSIARFFRGFGAKPSLYQRVHFSRQPVGWLKKAKNG